MPAIGRKSDYSFSPPSLTDTSRFFPVRNVSDRSSSFFSFSAPQNERGSVRPIAAPPPTHAGRKMGGALKKSEQEKNAHFLSSFHYFPLAEERNTEKRRISYYCSKKRYLTGISLCLGKEQKTKVSQHECNIALVQFSTRQCMFWDPTNQNAPEPLSLSHSALFVRRVLIPVFFFPFFRRTAPSISRADVRHR